MTWPRKGYHCRYLLCYRLHNYLTYLPVYLQKIFLTIYKAWITTKWHITFLLITMIVMTIIEQRCVFYMYMIDAGYEVDSLNGKGKPAHGRINLVHGQGGVWSAAPLGLRKDFCLGPRIVTYIAYASVLHTNVRSFWATWHHSPQRQMDQHYVSRLLLFALIWWLWALHCFISPWY